MTALLNPLDASVLVLNRHFMAIQVVSCKRAFTLLCKDAAEVVHPEDGQFLTYNFQSWREVSEFRSRHCSGLTLLDQFGAAGDPPSGL